MKKITTILFLAFSFIAFTQVPYKAEEFESALLQSKTGAFLVFNGEKHSFTIDLLGKITPNEKPNFLSINDNILQTLIIPFETKLDFENLTEIEQKENLIAYHNYELDYVKEQLNVKKLNEKYEFVKLNGKVFLKWTYDMPKSFNSVDKQSYLITICFDQILILNAPIINGKKLNEIQELLLKIGKTLKLINQPLDLEKLYNDLKGQ